MEHVLFRYLASFMPRNYFKNHLCRLVYQWFPSFMAEQCFQVSWFGSLGICYLMLGHLGLFPVLIYIYLNFCFSEFPPNWKVGSMAAETCLICSLLYPQHPGQ